MGGFTDLSPRIIRLHPLSEQEPHWSITGSIFVKVSFYYSMWAQYYIPVYLETGIEIREIE